MTEASKIKRGKTFKDLVGEAKGRIREVTTEELKQWQAQGKAFALLDVRETDDFQNGHIEGATHLSRGMLELDIDDVVPDQDTLIVTYCGGGSRSALAADTLQEMGYDNVFSLAGGYRGWKS